MLLLGMGNGGGKEESLIGDRFMTAIALDSNRDYLSMRHATISPCIGTLGLSEDIYEN